MKVPLKLLAGDQAVSKCERVIGHQLSSLALPPIILPPRNLSELIILDNGDRLLRLGLVVLGDHLNLATHVSAKLTGYAAST